MTRYKQRAAREEEGEIEGGVQDRGCKERGDKLMSFIDSKRCCDQNISRLVQCAKSFSVLPRVLPTTGESLRREMVHDGDIKTFWA